jgi:thioredoxin 1
MTTFHCTHCDRPIFHAADRLGTTNLWDLGDYQAEAHVIRRAIDEPGLRRYDVSLHEGWYCCRFIMMRMVVDKFGTGDALLVYADSVVEKQAGAPAAPTPPPHAVSLSERDHDAVLTSPALRDQLVMVKYGAIWCPPCRLMDRVIAQIGAEGSLPEVRFFEVDIDHEPALAGRFRNQSIPYSRFYYNGRPVPLTADDGVVVDGGLIGGLGRAALEALCDRLVARARSGAEVREMTY